MKVEQDEATRKEKQNKHYFYLNELQKMARELPVRYQQRLSYDLLCSLANGLLDGTVFEIVGSLHDVQQLEERNLFSQRVKLINEHNDEKQRMKIKHKEDIQKCQARPHNLPHFTEQHQKEAMEFEKRFLEEIKRKDMKIILELDQKVMDQQTTLEKAGVPGFSVTNNSNEVKLQMYLLDFIKRLKNMAVP